jgi:hypothetical protein
MLIFCEKQTGSIDITHTVRIKCAAEGCEEVDLCPNCFSEGRELGGHKAWHDYRVVVSTTATEMWMPYDWEDIRSVQADI